MRTCGSCKTTLSGETKAGRRDVCPACGADLRSCRNCRFYDRAASKQCRETVSELVREKEKANYCDYFVFAEDRNTGPDSGSEQAARQSLEGLFKK
jgi:hypothetical protein